MFNTIMMKFGLRDVTDVTACVHVYTCCVSQGIIKILFKRDRLWYHFVPNLLEYKYAKNYQNRA